MTAGAPLTVTGIDDLTALIAARAVAAPSAFVVAIDGRSGAGKSTLAAALADRLGACCIEGDDFYAGGISLRNEPAERLAACCIDWTRQREVLLSLRCGQTARWRAFDWDAFDGRLVEVPTLAEPSSIILLEGVYSARPELADLLELKVLMEVEAEERTARLYRREGELSPWEQQWHAAEAYYFEATMPVEQFDIVVRRSVIKE